MRKSLLSFLLVSVAPISCLFGCQKRTPVSCDIVFRKENKIDGEEFESMTFEINTKIYVHVSFNLTNYSKEDDTVSFIVDIPGAQYYSTYDFEYGTKEPEVDVISREQDGSTIDVIHLSNMQFVIPKDRVTYHKDFIFSIAANQPCENMSFEAKFNSDEDFFQPKDRKVFKKNYSFVEQGGGN